MFTPTRIAVITRIVYVVILFTITRKNVYDIAIPITQTQAFFLISSSFEENPPGKKRGQRALKNERDFNIALVL